MGNLLIVTPQHVKQKPYWEVPPERKFFVEAKYRIERTANLSGVPL